MSVRTTSFNGTVSTDLPQWNQSALRLLRQDTEQECQIAERSATSTAGRRPSMHRSLTRRQRRMSTMTRSNSGQPYAAADAARETAHRIVEAGSSLMPASAVPPHALPGVIVRRFAFLVAFLWLVSAVTHCLRWTGSAIIEGTEPAELSTGVRLATAWPSPAQLFEVDALHCDGSTLFAQSRFGFFTGELRDGAAVLEEADAFAQNDTVLGSAVWCPTTGSCSFLVKTENQERDLAEFDVFRLDSGAQSQKAALESLGHSAGQPAKVRLPASWRRLAVHQPARNATGRDQLHIVGWDGLEVFFASVRHGDVRAKPRFVLRPGRMCQSSLTRWPKVSALLGRHCAPGPENYTDVQALQFAPDGSLLLVLHGKGFLDAWRPMSGELLGRWHLQRPSAGFAASFCVQAASRRIIVAWQMQRAAPQLEALPLPHRLDSGGCEDSGTKDVGKLII